VRYARQLKLLGEAGQKRLRAATVTIAGAGGLGSVSAAYLTAAGIGHIRIVDDDVVELSNLNRQMLHWDDDLGTQKADSFRRKLSCMNPAAVVTMVTQRIDEETVTEIVRDSDAIVDALDNFHTRYLLNRAALQTGIPYFYGGVQGFDGQAATIIPGKTACLRCIFPEAYPSEPVSVIGPTCGVIGSIQAAEVVKYPTGVGLVYERYNRGELISDDEVTLLFDPETFQPRVNIRYNLDHAAAKGIIDQGMKNDLISGT